MQVLINGELCFRGTEKQAIEYAQKLADQRRKSEQGKAIVKERKKYGYGHWQGGWGPAGKWLNRELDCKKIEWPSLKIEFVK
jgi:hypothetical protein